MQLKEGIDKITLVYRTITSPELLGEAIYRGSEKAGEKAIISSQRSITRGHARLQQTGTPRVTWRPPQK